MHIDIGAFLDDASMLFQQRIRKAVNKYGAIKVYGVLAAKFRRVLNDEEVVTLKTFMAKTSEIFNTTLLEDWFQKNIKNSILRKVEEFQDSGSDWTLHSIVKLEININKYNPLRASSFITLPYPIKKKRACLNVENKNDDECFRWAVLSALFPVDGNDHPERVSHYKPRKGMLDFTGIKFPVTLMNVPKFEKQNDVSINVYGLVRRKFKYNVVPLHVTSEKKEQHINLLYIQDDYIDESLNDDVFELDGENTDFFNFHYV